MDKRNQTEKSYETGNISASIKLTDGRLKLSQEILHMGRGNYRIGVSYVYRSNIDYPVDYGINTALGGGWKLNVEQYMVYKPAENKYIYIDGAGYENELVYYKTENNNDYYYDIEGLGLVYSTGERRLSETFRNSQNTCYKIFNEIGQLIQETTSTNTRAFLYGSNGKLLEIYDEQKNYRKLKFYYDETSGRLIRINHIKETTDEQVNDIKSVEFNYYNNNLQVITTTSRGRRKPIAIFDYDNQQTSRINVVSDNYGKSVLGFEHYEISNGEIGVCCVVKGNCENTVVTNYNETDSIYSKSDHFGSSDDFGSIAYCGESNCGEKLSYNAPPNLSYRFSNVMQEKWDNFFYESDPDCGYIVRTVVQNERGICTEYNFNAKGQAVSSFEIKYEDIQNPWGQKYTLSRARGISLLDKSIYRNEQGQVRIYDSAFTLSDSGGINNSLTLYSDYMPITLNFDNSYMFKPWYLSSAWMFNNEKVTEYMLTMWLKLVEQTDEDKYIVGKVNYELNDEIKSVDIFGLLDYSAYNAWQNVSLQFQLPENARFNSIELNVNGPTENCIKFELSDIRIAHYIQYDVKVGDMSLSKQEEFDYTIAATDSSTSDTDTWGYLSTDFYITENDLLLTAKNMCLSPNKFDLICCNGTKRIANVKRFGLPDENNNVTYLAIDSDGEANFKRKVVYPTGSKVSTTEYILSSTGTEVRLTEKTYIGNSKDPNAQITKNGLDQIVEEVDAYGVKTTYEYTNGNLNKIAVENANGAEIISKTYTYDLETNGTKEYLQQSVEGGVTTDYEYNTDAGVVKSKTVGGAASNALKTENEYSAYYDKVSKVTEKNGNNVLRKHNFIYGSNGKIKEINVGGECAYGFEYDMYGNVVKYYSRNLANGTTKVMLEKEYKYFPDEYDVGYNEYEKQEALKYTKDGVEKRITAYSDKYGRTTKVQDENGQETTYTYQQFGDVINADYYQNFEGSPSLAKVTVMHDPYEQRDYTYTYDVENELSSYTAEAVPEKGFGKVTVTSLGENKTRYDFDSIKVLGNSQATSMGKTSEIQYESKAKNPNSNKQPRIKKTIDKGLAFDSDENTYEYNYSYDEIGRLSTITNANRTQNITYNNAKNLPTEIKHSAIIIFSGVQEKTYRNTYDEKGNITSVKDLLYNIGFDDENSINNEVKYTYNPLGQITSEQHLYTKNIDGEVEEFDNTNYYCYNNKNLLTRIETTEGTPIKRFTYNAYGNVLQYISGTGSNQKLYSHTYDDMGNVTKISHAGQHTILQYGRRNLLTSYGDIQYEYNSRGVRIAKESNGARTVYINDGEKLLGEQRYKADGTWDERITYYNDALGVCGMRYNKDGDSANYVYLRDLQGNVRQILNAIGIVVANYFYDTWGNCTVTDEYGEEITDMSHIGHKNPYRWKSYYYDVDTGLYLIGSRYYNPETGRFLQSMDIAAIDENSISELIGYVNSNRYTATLAYNGFKYAVSSADTVALSLNRVLENNPLAVVSTMLYNIADVSTTLLTLEQGMLLHDYLSKIHGNPPKLKFFTKSLSNVRKLNYLGLGIDIAASMFEIASDYISTSDESRMFAMVVYEASGIALGIIIGNKLAALLGGPIGALAYTGIVILLDVILGDVLDKFQDKIVNAIDNFFEKVIDKIF